MSYETSAKEDKTLDLSHFQKTSEEEAEEAASQCALPKDKWLPLIFRELMRNAPEPYKVATFFAAATCLSCVATRIRVYYSYDGLNEHALLLQRIISGEQSSGKSLVHNNIKKVVMAHLRRRDEEQRQQEQAYREMKQTASKAEKLPSPPTHRHPHLPDLHRPANQAGRRSAALLWHAAHPVVVHRRAERRRGEQQAGLLEHQDHRPYQLRPAQHLRCRLPERQCLLRYGRYPAMLALPIHAQRIGRLRRQVLHRGWRHHTHHPRAAQRRDRRGGSPFQNAHHGAAGRHRCHPAADGCRCL